MTILQNTTRQSVLADKVRLCRGFWDRLKGLLGTTKLGVNEACWIVPCSSVHTFGMRYPIDVYFLNKNNEVTAISKSLQPNRFSPVHPAAHSAIEFSSGAQRDCRVGDKLILNQKGQAMVELALMIIIFFAFLMALSDMIRICYNWASLQYAVSEGARFGSLDQTPDGSTREASIEKRVVDAAKQLGVQGVTVSFEDSNKENSAGDPLTFFNLKAKKTVTLNPLSDLLMKISGDYHGQYIVNAEAITRNEPFGT